MLFVAPASALFRLVLDVSAALANHEDASQGPDALSEFRNAAGIVTYLKVSARSSVTVVMRYVTCTLTV